MPRSDSSPSPSQADQRLFLACVPDPALAVRMHALGAAHRRDGRAVPAENLHLTLAFLGSIPEARIAVCRAAVDGLSPPADVLHLDRVGFWRRSGILWLAPSQPSESLAAYVRALRTALAGSGFPVESRSFKAHITLVRKCRQPPRRKPVEALEWTIGRVDLMASILDPAGARYTSLHRWSA